MRLLLALGLVLLPLAVFLQVRHHELLNYDDRIYIKRLASEGERPLFIFGIAAIVIGLVIALVGIWSFVKRKS